MTKVFHVIPGLGLGGAEATLAGLVAAPGRRSVPIVVNLLSGGAHAERIRGAGVELIELGMRGLASVPATVRRLARLIREREPDVVQGWMYYGDLVATLALRLSGRRPATRLYWGVRCSDMEIARYGLPLKATVAACRRLSRMPDAVIANSEAGRAVHQRLGYRAKSFLVIPNGIDTVRFRPAPAERTAIRADLGIPSGARVVILPARTDPMKDHGTFLATMDLLPEITAIAAGLGTETLPPRANLIGLGTRADMPALYAASDLMVLSSAYGEGFSTVLGEAMACGLSAAVTDVGDAARIIGETGVVVPPRDPAALAGAIRTFFGKPAKEREALGAAARRRIETQFSLDRAVTAFEDVYLGGAAACAA